MTGTEIRNYAEASVAEALETQRQQENAPASLDVNNEADEADEEDEEGCGMYAETCNNQARIEAIRGMLDHPHGDDSPCMDPVWSAADAVLNQVLSGIESALSIE